MAAERPRRWSRPRSLLGLLGSLGFLLLASVTAAQAPAKPTVPTDRYGPPICVPGQPAVNGLDIDRAHQEQHLGARDAHSLLSAEPMENFDIVRSRLEAYAACTGTDGCYWADLDAQYHRAEETLKEKTAGRHSGEKLALVMDIDETSLSGYCEMQREDFGYIDSMFNTWLVSPEASIAIPGALRLFHEAQTFGIAVFFITGRHGVPDPNAESRGADQTAATERNLQAAGFRGWTGLALRNGQENSLPTIEYKARERHRIVEQGYRIVMSVGDQWSDLLGDPKAEVSVKLPNPFYFLP